MPGGALSANRRGVNDPDWDRKVPPRLPPPPPLSPGAGDVGYACMWMAAAARLLEELGHDDAAERVRAELERIETEVGRR